MQHVDVINHLSWERAFVYRSRIGLAACTEALGMPSDPGNHCVKSQTKRN
jgi:hypothetical protein